MGKKLLFSPIGGTDPIKYFRDGSMLHICRHYRPDIVYLYLSHEMMEFHRGDNRYVDAVERLGKFIGHKFEIHIIERDALTEVQQYDIFYEDFRQEIQKIEKTMEQGDELLLNMSSGTPAMKSALLVMATFAEYRFLPIQVSTPQRKMNDEYENRKNYENDVDWELDKDNMAGAPKRCTEVKCLNLMRLIRIDAIKKHIHAYDYPAALSVAEDMEHSLNEDAYRLLQIADARMKLDHSKISRLMAQKKYAVYPIEESGRRKIFEYALSLQIKIKKQDYADFVRGITPLVVDLLEAILKNACGIDLDQYCSTDRKGVRVWDLDKLRQAGLLTALSEGYRGAFRQGPVYSNNIEKLISKNCRDSTLCQKVQEIVKIEGTVRNMAAHEIISVTEDWILKKTGKTVEQIFSIIKTLTVRAGIRAGNKDWESYESMNKLIEAYLDD